MATLYVVEQGAEIGCHSERIEVRRDANVIGSVPLVKLEDIIIFGNIAISTPALKRLLDRGIEVTFMTVDGRYQGRLIGQTTAHVALRQAQYAFAADTTRALRLAQSFVEGKLRNQRAVLQRFCRNRANPPAEASAAAADLDAFIQRVGRTTKLSSLLGVEGSATARYFSGLRSLIGPEWNFSGRQRRPPPDPVNLLLSFGYTLLTHKALGAIQAVGFDPYLGYLHSLDYGRPSLALDLMEEFRPILIDALVARLCNDGRLQPSHFHPGDDERPVIISEAGKRIFLAAFEERMRTEATHPEGADSGPGKVPYTRCILLQARRLARVIRGERERYEPFTAR